jgi:hypothetical protein
LDAGRRQSSRPPKLIVIGAVSPLFCEQESGADRLQLGRCGQGAVQLAKDVGISESDIIRWDLEETKGGSFVTIFLLHVG